MRRARIQGLRQSHLCEPYFRCSSRSVAPKALTSTAPEHAPLARRARHDVGARRRLPPAAAAARRRLTRLWVHKLRAPFGHDYLSRLGQGLEPETLTERWIASGVPRWLTLTDEVLFVVASAMFIRGSFGFFPGASVAEYIEGCELYEIGSVVYLALSVFALWEIFEDARLTGEAPRAASVLEQACAATAAARGARG